MIVARFPRLPTAVLGVLLLGSLGMPSSAQVITEIIDATGDGAGNALSHPSATTVDDSGNAFVAGGGSDNVFKITPGGVITEIIDATGDGAGNLLDSPTDLAVDSAGNVYVTGLASVNAFKITPGGAITEIIDSTGDGLGNTLSFPRAIAVDGTGNVYVGAGFGNPSPDDKVFKISPEGLATEIIDSTGDGAGNLLGNPLGVASDSTGNVYVVGGTTTNVFKITPSGVIEELTDFTEDPAWTVETLYTAAVSESDSVYVTAARSDPVLFRITSGGVVTPVATLAAMGGPCLTVAVDGFENVYAQCGDAIHKINPLGVITELPGAELLEIDLTVAPFSVAVDSQGTVYFAGNNDNAYRITQATVVPALSHLGLAALSLSIVLIAGRKLGSRFGSIKPS
jgi:hypothetical protein